MRKLPLALACALIFGSSNALAIGLGELQTQSYLNQPLRAVIPLTDVRPGDLDALSVKIADEAQFARHGYSLLSVYGRIKMQIVTGQRPHILLTSDTPVRDPVLGLVIEVDGPSGTLERAVSILLDPEGYVPVAISKPSARSATSMVVSAPTLETGATTPVRASTASAPTQRQTAVRVSAMPDGGDYGPVAEGATLWGIAQSVRPSGVGVQQAMAAILQANPQAFGNPEDANTLRAGANLKIPDAQTMRQVQRPVVRPASAKPATSGVAPQTAAPVAEPRLAIVQPMTQATKPASSTPNVAVAPVVGEMVSAGTGAQTAPSTEQAPSQQANQPAAMSAEMLEQFEANKLENERLTGLLASQDERLQKMEELLRINETLIKEMEKKQEAASAPVVSAPVAVDVKPSMPWWSTWLMGLGALVAMVLAYLFGARRRQDEKPQAEPAHVKSVQDELVSLRKPQTAEQAESQADSLVSAPAVATATAVAAMVSEPAMPDPVQAALEEADVMQAYGLHDRALQVLGDALRAQPGNLLLMARYARAQHEAGDGEAFVREAQAFREQHPQDETQWVEIRALGEANYPDAPLFKSGYAIGAAKEISSEVAADTDFWSSPAQNATQESDDTSALTQPLESLDFGAPQSALNEFLAGRDASSSQPVPPDMPLLDLPEIAEPGTSALETPSDNLADFVEEWAPLELPTAEVTTPPAWSVDDALGMREADADQSLQELSADDLAILGIDASGLHAAGAAHPESVAHDAAVEPEFVDDQQLNVSIDKEPADALELFLSSNSGVVPKFEPLESLNLDSVSLAEDAVLSSQDAPYPVPETMPGTESLAAPELTLEIDQASESLPESLPEPGSEPMSEPLALHLPDMSMLAPIALPEYAPVPASTETSGMVSEEEVKLDIALAFIDLGDIAGAREMLEEVLASECDLALRERAMQLIGSLSV
jgi:FimV-like protein